MYELVGRLMGHSMRHKQFLPFALPALVWKALVGQPLALADIADVDEAAAGRIARVQAAGEALEAATAAAMGTGAGAGATTAAATAAAAAAAAAFAAAVQAAGGDAFTIPAADGAVVELLPGGSGGPAAPAASGAGGAARPPPPHDAAGPTIGPGSWRQFVSLAARHKLHEFDRQVAALRRGFLGVVPERAVKVCGWAELELLTCGDPHVDVDVLRAHTEYAGGYSAGHRVVRAFWAVLRGLTDDERSRFVRFACGRARLPRGAFVFRLTRRAAGDESLPVSHSCFFHVELPAYSSEEVMRRRLLATVHFGLDAYLMV